MALTARPIVINELLCFMTRKYGRYGPKQLKSLLFDFYSGDVISIAKDTLYNSIVNLKIEGLPKSIARRRRDSKEANEVKIRLDINDIVLLIAFLDEGKLVDHFSLQLTRTFCRRQD